MKGKRPTTEQKIRILRKADGGKNIVAEAYTRIVAVAPESFPSETHLPSYKALEHILVR